MNSENFQSVQIAFFKQDFRFFLKSAVSDSLPFISQSACNSRSGTPPSAKPPMHRMNPTYSSSQEISKPQNYSQIITEQTKLIEKLQAQVYTLQKQVSPKSKSCLSSPTDSKSEKVNTETNTTFSIYSQKRLKSSKKICFDSDERTDERAEEKKKIYVSKMFNHPKLPTIHYNKSSSESSDEENIRNLQFKYSKITQN